MDKREKEYIQCIAQEIRRAKRGTLFFSEGASRNADLTMLLEALSARRTKGITAFGKREAPDYCTK